MMDKKIKVALIGTNGIPAKYGGFETLTEYLAKGLNKEFEVTVYCSKTPKEKRLKQLYNSKLLYLPFKANGWQSMIYDAFSIFHAFFISDVLVILGFSGVIAFPFKIYFESKIVFNIGGVEWKKIRGTRVFSKLEIILKRLFERICIYYSDVIIVDNQEILNYVKSTYDIDSTLIEYGGDHAENRHLTTDIISKYPFLTKSYDVSVSRAQEDMNIHLLLDAYKKYSSRNIVIISNWEISSYGIQLKETFKNKYKNIYILDSIYNLDELNAIRSNAELYLHTHSLCGTAPSLTEAMSLGLAVFCYDVPTNRATTEEKSFYFCDSKSLVELLQNLNSLLTNKLRNDMKEIADRRYNWKRIINLYKKSIN